ncbi:MAG: Na/Pi cotransporter family protein [Paludibacteraceae bacterium]|nr:Na/Pi cotransporter family protein [Paludibacteraceae bacterium]
MNGSLLGFLTFGGALALSVYGIKLQSEGLQKLSSGWVRRVLSAMTRNRLMGVLTGLLTALLVQSSAATTLMVVGFVNAEILSLLQAVTVIMGVNIGASLTGWLVAWLGFDWGVGLLSLPLVACSVPFLFSSNSHRRSIGDVLLGLSLLLIGVFLLRGSMPQAVSHFDIYSFWAGFCHAGFGSVLLFALLGVLLVLFTQSSQASLIVVLLVAGAGWIPVKMALALVVGVNLGAALPPFIASLPANVSARRAALIHLLFNAFGTVWMLLLLSPFTRWVARMVAATGVGDPIRFYQLLSEVDLATLTLISSPHAVLTPAQLELQYAFEGCRMATVYGIALFHTLFNLTNTVLLAWFDKYLVQFSARMLPQNEGGELFRLAYLEPGAVSTAEIALLQADQEILVYAKRCARMYGIVRGLYTTTDETDFLEGYSRVEKYEEISDRMEVELANYLTRSSDTRLSDGAKHDILAMLQAVSALERVADGCHALAKSFNRRRLEAVPYIIEMDQHVDEVLTHLEQRFDTLLQLLRVTGLDEKYRLVEQANRQAEELAALQESLRMQNAADVNDRKYPYQVSITYLSILDNCALISASLSEVVEQYRRTRKGAA